MISDCYIFDKWRFKSTFLEFHKKPLKVKTQPFGVKIYSDLFNTKLEPSLQQTYLTLFSTKDGVKNYSMLIDSMNTLVAKETDFYKGFF